MTESEVRKLLRQMKELDSQTAFRDFYNMTYDRLFRIAYYYAGSYTHLTLPTTPYV